MRVTPPPMFDSSRPVMSWRMVLKALVRQGPVQFAPPSYEKYSPSFVPATTRLLLFGSTRTLPTALYCGNCPAGSGNAGPNTVGARTVQFAPASVDLRMPWLPMGNEP